jgi:hypothetical protein
LPEPTTVTDKPKAQPVSIRWYGKGEKVSVGDYVLTDPLIYLAPGPAREHEASCIDATLPIGRPIDEQPGSLGYYPHYAGITRRQRANYVQWLSHGRCQPLSDIGYAFLYFYGLERRLLIEQKDLGYGQ